MLGRVHGSPRAYDEVGILGLVHAYFVVQPPKQIERSMKDTRPLIGDAGQRNLSFAQGSALLVHPLEDIDDRLIRGVTDL